MFAFVGFVGVVSFLGCVLVLVCRGCFVLSECFWLVLPGRFLSFPDGSFHFLSLVFLRCFRRCGHFLGCYGNMEEKTPDGPTSFCLSVSGKDVVGRS